MFAKLKNVSGESHTSFQVKVTLLNISLSFFISHVNKLFLNFALNIVIFFNIKCLDANWRNVTLA